MKTTAWYFRITPEILYSLGGADYSATLTIGGNEYTITVPNNIELSDGSHTWYPAVGLLGDKVYGEAQYLADLIDLDNYTSVKFLSDPSDLTFPDGFLAGAQGEDGKWGVALNHGHDWALSVSDDGATLTATCRNAGCPYETTSVTLALSRSDKTYDNNVITATAKFDEYFEDIFTKATTTISITKDGETVDAIKDVGEYIVTMTVTGVGNDETEEYTLVKNVVVSPLDIAGATVTFNPSSITYDGKEHTVTCTVSKNGVDVTTFDIAEGSVTSATKYGEYTVTLNGTGNFEGTATATWEIKNTTGSLKSVKSTVTGVGDFDSESNTLTVDDTTALEYSDGAWYAGLTLTWPMTALNVSLNPLRDGSADYVKPDKMQMTIDGNVYAGSEIVSDEAVYSAGKLDAEVSNDTYKYYESVFSQPTKQFEYLATTTWKVAIAPAIIESAIANNDAELVYTMNAGAFVWEDGREGDADGVAFADYTITLPLDEPVEFVLGEGEAYDLGDTVLATTKIQLAAGASVTSSVAQTEGLIYTEVTGYDVVRSEDGGKYVYTAQLTHEHDWRAKVADNDYELVATCANADCDINGGEVKMWLEVETAEKVYDGQSVTCKAVYGDGFMAAFPDAGAVLTVNGVENGVINDAGEYAVVLAVAGVGETTYTLSRTVTISKVDITGATLVLTPATTTYNGQAQTVVPSVTVDGLTATIEMDVENSTTAATEIGTYSVTVTGTGNFTGTAATATWTIENTTGAPTSVAATVADSMTASGNDFTLSDSSKLEYDAEKGEWYAGITITWPLETKDFEKTSWSYYAHYVTEDSVKATTEQGEITHAKVDASYEAWNGSYNLLGDMTETKPFTCVATTTWKVALTPAVIEAALAEEKASLTYTMNAGAFVWGDSTEGDTNGVAFADYKITIPLDENLKLFNADGEQVYPKATAQTIIEEIKSDIADTVSSEVAQGAAAKIDLLADVVGEGNEQAVADWVDAKKGENAAAFYEALAQSEYAKASFTLDTEDLITDASEVEVAEFSETEDGFTFAVKIDGGDIEAARVKAASIVKTATSLGDGEFGPLDAERIEISEAGEMTVKKADGASREFFTVIIDKD